MTAILISLIRQFISIAEIVRASYPKIIFAILGTLRLWINRTRVPVFPPRLSKGLGWHNHGL